MIPSPALKTQLNYQYRYFQIYKISNTYVPCTLFSGGVTKQESHRRDGKGKPKEPTVYLRNKRKGNDSKGKKRRLTKMPEESILLRGELWQVYRKEQRKAKTQKKVKRRP